ncbi:MAG: CARDB domain-containing protein [Nanoarchaeota archaeon]
MQEINKNTKNSPGNFLTKILTIFLILLFAVFVAYLSYFLYRDIPRAPQNLDFEINNNETFSNITTEISQFHPNMKFNHNNISYKINSDCDIVKKQRMINAFNILSENVNIISFHEIIDDSEISDIEITCTQDDKSLPDIEQEQKKNYFIAGECGAREIIQTGKFNVITNGTVLLFKYPENSLDCKYPNIEMHELMHVFGFDHSEDKNSIMNSYLVSCKQRLDISIINELKRLYSMKNLPDLYFESLKAVKKGRYLDFNLTIKNLGLIDADNVTFSILDNNELVETNKAGDIKFGAGIMIRIENLKLINLNSRQITFKIDNDNNIKELDKSNNIAEVKFPES